MSSTDDPRDDDARGEEPTDESVLPPGPRRSTYTPPVPRQPTSPTTDDDELADVIAANLASATGSINVIYQLDDVAPSVPMGAPIEQLAAPGPDARILPADVTKTAPAEAPEAPEAAAMPSPDATAIPVDLPPPSVFDSFEFGPQQPEPEPSVVFNLDAEPAASQAPVAHSNVETPAAHELEWEEEPASAEQPESAFVFDLNEQPEPVVFEPAAWEPEPEPEPAEAEQPESAFVYDLDAEQTEPVAFEPAAWEPEPAEAEQPESAFVFDLNEQPEPVVFEPAAWEPEPWDPESPDEFGVAEQTATPEPAAELFEIPEVPPRSSDGPFDEAAFLAASAAPAGQRPWIPERQSLRDEELAALVQNGADHPGGTLGVMEELERQVQLREDETREFSEWQESMLAVGTPEALAAVEAVLPDFFDIVAPSTTSIPVQAAPAQLLDAEQPLDEEAARLAFDSPPPFDATRLEGPPPIFAPPPAFDEPRFDGPPDESLPEPKAESEFTFAEPVFTAEPGFESELDYDAEPTFEPAPEPIEEIPVFIAASEPPALVEPPAMPDAWDFSSVSPLTGTDADPIFIEPVPADEASPPQPLVEPAPFGTDPFVNRILTGPVPDVTGSVPVAPRDFDVERDDDVDPTDQVPASFDDLLGPSPGTAPIEPILSARVPEDEVVLGDPQQPQPPRVFSLESVGLEPTPEEQRIGRASRMFWMWFAANSSLVAIVFGAVIFSLGLSLRQAIVGILAGVAISFLPLGLGTLAGKRSAQPTMVVSRAAFGVMGNVAPALLAVVSRVFWGAALLWLLATGVSEILVGAEATGGLEGGSLTIIALVVGFMLALVVALFGYGLLAKFQLIVSIVSGILVVGVIALTASYVNVPSALTNPDGSWMLAVSAAVLVFSFIGLLWANSSGDLARYQRTGSSGAGAMLWTTFGAAVPTFVLISYGALLAASNEQIADGLLTLPFDTIGRLLPVWYPVPLIMALSLSLLSGVIVTVYSGGFALKAVGVNLARPAAVVVTGVLVAAGSLLLTTMSTDVTILFRDLATTLAVPVAAWAGIFAADTMIRNRRYHSDSLLRAGGVYPIVNWVNLAAFLAVTALGFGLTSSTLTGLTWQGFLWPIFGVAPDSTLAATDIGVFAALLLGLLVPIVSGMPRIRRQESASPPEN